MTASDDRPEPRIPGLAITYPPDLPVSQRILVSFVGRGARFFLVGAAIYFFGPSIQTLIDEYLDILTVSFLVLLVLGFLAVKYGGAYLSARQGTPEESEIVE